MNTPPAAQNYPAGDEESFLRRITFLEEDRHLFTSATSDGGYRWFRSSNIVPIEHRRLSRRPETLIRKGGGGGGCGGWLERDLLMLASPERSTFGSGRPARTRPCRWPSRCHAVHAFGCLLGRGRAADAKRLRGFAKPLHSQNWELDDTRYGDIGHSAASRAGGPLICRPTYAKLPEAPTIRATLFHRLCV